MSGKISCVRCNLPPDCHCTGPCSQEFCVGVHHHYQAPAPPTGPGAEEKARADQFGSPGVEACSLTIATPGPHAHDGHGCSEDRTVCAVQEGGEHSGGYRLGKKCAFCGDAWEVGIGPIAETCLTCGENEFAHCGPGDCMSYPCRRRHDHAFSATVVSYHVCQACGYARAVIGRSHSCDPHETHAAREERLLAAQPASHAAALVAAEERGRRAGAELATKAECSMCREGIAVTRNDFGRWSHRVMGGVGFWQRECDAAKAQEAFRLAGWVAE